MRELPGRVVGLEIVIVSICLNCPFLVTSRASQSFTTHNILDDSSGPRERWPSKKEKGSRPNHGAMAREQQEGGKARVSGGTGA